MMLKWCKGVRCDEQTTQKCNDEEILSESLEFRFNFVAEDIDIKRIL